MKYYFPLKSIFTLGGLILVTDDCLRQTDPDSLYNVLSVQVNCFILNYLTFNLLSPASFVSIQNNFGVAQNNGLAGSRSFIYKTRL